MKKLFCTFLVVGSLQLAANAQQAIDKQALANADTKTALVSKLSLSEQTADKIIEIESEFYASVAAANIAAQKTESAKKAAQEKVHDAHVVRRTKLMAVPLTGRQMEDVISISTASRIKHKL